MAAVAGGPGLVADAEKKNRSFTVIKSIAIEFVPAKQVGMDVNTIIGDVMASRYQVEAQPDHGPGSEIGTSWKIGVTWSQKRSFKMAAAELGYLLTKSSFSPSLWHDISISWHGRKEL